MKAGTGVSDTGVLVAIIWLEMSRMYLDEVYDRWELEL